MKKNNKIIVCLLLISFLFMFSLTLVSSFLSLYLDELEIGLLSIGLIFAIGIFIAGLVGVFVGFYGDEFSKKKIILASVISGIIFSLILILTKSVYGVAISKVVLEIARSLSFIGFFSYLYDFVDKKIISTLTSAVFVSSMFGSFLSPIVSGYLINNYSFNYIFVLSLIIMSLVFVIALFFLEDKKFKVKKLKITKEVEDLTKNLHFWKITVISSIIVVISVFFLIYLPIYLKDIGWNYEMIGLLFGGATFVLMVMQIPLGKFLTKFKSRFVMTGSNVILSMFIYVITILYSFFWIFLSNLFVQISLNTASIKANLVITGITNKKEHGGAIAIFNFVKNSLLALCTFLSAVLIINIGFVKTFFLFSILSFIVALIYYFTYTPLCKKMEKFKKINLHPHHIHLFHDNFSFFHYLHENHKVKKN